MFSNTYYIQASSGGDGQIQTRSWASMYDSILCIGMLLTFVFVSFKSRCKLEIPSKCKRRLYYLAVPWDATDYDVVIPIGGDVDLLYMRGHLCFFRAGHETEEKLNLYDYVSKMVWYFNHHRPHFAAGVSSSFFFVKTSI